MSHSSQESKLHTLRKNLSDLTLELVGLLDQRRDIASQIQEMKIPRSGFYRFDPKREREVFLHLKKHLESKSIKELFAISLLIEDHAQQGEAHTYPSWSSQIHLNQPSSELFGQINPVMLEVLRPDLMTQLTLRDDFKDILK